MDGLPCIHGREHRRRIPAPGRQELRLAVEGEVDGERGGLPLRITDVVGHRGADRRAGREQPAGALVSQRAERLELLGPAGDQGGMRLAGLEDEAPPRRELAEALAERRRVGRRARLPLGEERLRQRDPRHQGEKTENDPEQKVPAGVGAGGHSFFEYVKWRGEFWDSYSTGDSHRATRSPSFLVEGPAAPVGEVDLLGASRGPRRKACSRIAAVAGQRITRSHSALKRKERKSRFVEPDDGDEAVRHQGLGVQDGRLVLEDPHARARAARRSSRARRGGRSARRSAPGSSSRTSTPRRGGLAQDAPPPARPGAK